MTQFQMQIAGRVVTVRAIFESTKEFCRDYLCTGAADFSVDVTPEDIDFEREKSAREDELEGKPVRDLSDSYLETIAVQRKIVEQLFEYDCLLFHGSVVAVDGEGYLFTAKSGTGKSTHTRLWREVLGERAVMVDDDKPILRLSEGAVVVCGTPWNGKHHLGENICVPLKAICVLERGEENRIRAITPQEVLPTLVQQSNRPRRAHMMGKYLELIDGVSRGVAFYRLACNMDPAAARLSYTTMSGRKGKLKIKGGFVLQEVAGQTVVVPMGSGLDLNMMITLNDTGTFLWKQLGQETDEAALVDALLTEYDVDRETACDHVAAFVEKLRGHGFLA